MTRGIPTTTSTCRTARCRREESAANRALGRSRPVVLHDAGAAPPRGPALLARGHRWRPTRPGGEPGLDRAPLSRGRCGRPPAHRGWLHHLSAVDRGGRGRRREVPAGRPERRGRLHAFQPGVVKRAGRVRADSGSTAGGAGGDSGTRPGRRGRRRAADEGPAGRVDRLPRHWTRPLGGVGVAAVLLAGVGVFGMLSYAVSIRRREIRVRIALGAPAGRVAAMFVFRGLGPRR